MTRTRILACLALVGLAASQQACLQSTLLPAHRLQHGEVTIGGGVELSASSRVSANATVGIGDVADLSLFGAYGSAFFLVQTYSIGAAGRVYMPFDWALSAHFARDSFLTPLGDTTDVGALWQGQLRFLSMPTPEFPLYFGPVATSISLQVNDVETPGNALVFVGALAGVNYKVSDQLNIQTELLVRPFLFTLIDGADSQSTSIFDNTFGQAFGQIFGFFQINFGGNFSLTKPAKPIKPSEPVEPDRRL